MNRRTLTLPLVFCLVMLIVVCLHLLLRPEGSIRPVSADAPTGQSWTLIGPDFGRLVDYDFGVVCYTTPYPHAAIACVRAK